MPEKGLRLGLTSYLPIKRKEDLKVFAPDRGFTTDCCGSDPRLSPQTNFHFRKVDTEAEYPSKSDIG